MTLDNSSIDDVCRRMYEKEQAQLKEGEARKAREAREKIKNAKKQGKSMIVQDNPVSSITFTNAGNLFIPDYYVTDAGVYAEHIAGIRDDNHHPTVSIDGKTMHRPATFKEGIEVRVYVGEKIIADNKGLSKEKLREKLNTVDVFATYQDSITGIAYQAKSTLFKIIPVCAQLINIPKDDRQEFLSHSYATMQGRDLDSSNGTYNKSLTKEEFLANEGWDEALDHDIDLKVRFASIIYSVYEQACGFYVLKNTEEDQVRALCAINLNLSSNAYGNLILTSYARFLRVGPNSSAVGGGRKK